MQYAYQSMRLDLDRLNAMRPPASVYLASVRSCKQSTHVTLPELILNQSHWSKLRLSHHRWPEIWASWRFRVINDETVAVQTQNYSWIAILALHGVDKEVGSGSRNFLESFHFLNELFAQKKMDHPTPSPTSARVSIISRTVAATVAHNLGSDSFLLKLRELKS